MTLRQFRSSGGKARAKALTTEQRIEIARKGGLAKQAKRLAKLQAEVQTT